MRLNRSALSLALLGGLFPGNSFGAAPNQPPTACFSVIPTNGTVDTAFKTDADCSSDDRTAPSRLRVRWDWENDGTWDTPYSTTKSATHQYANEGIKTIKLEVRDSAGLTGTTTQGVLVLPTLRQALVGEPPSTPGATEPDVDLDPEDPRKLVASAITGSLGEISRPAETAVVTDGVLFMTNRPDYSIIFTWGCDAGNAHQGGGNHVFADGHAQWIARNSERYLQQDTSGCWFKKYYTIDR